MEQTGAPDHIGQIARQIIEAFFLSPHLVAGILSIGLAALIVGGFWVLRGSVAGVRTARVALRATQLRTKKDHRALVLVAGMQGGASEKLREEVTQAINDHFGSFAFQAPVLVEDYPMKLAVLGEKAPAAQRRKLAQTAVDMLDSTLADVIIWGKRSMNGQVELRIVTPPAPGQIEEVHPISFRWRPKDGFDGLGEAVAYACARRARPVLNKPQDYKPEKLQPIVEALDKLVNHPPASLSETALLEILSDFASGALSLGERGGEVGWLMKALDARRQFLDRVDRGTDPAAWGRAQQEVGRALAALGEREADRAKLEEAVNILRTSLDALRATENLQSAEVAMRALSRAEQTLAARKRIGLRWPV